MIIKIFQPQAIHELGKRENQEDTIYPKLGSATISDRLFIVCDGMGGHEKGEVASQTVCSALSEYINNNSKVDEPLSDYTFTVALEYAFSKLDEKDSQSIKKMGTTLTFLCLHRGGCTVAHIGDSRIYHIRPSESRLLYKSRDHSLVFDLYQAGEISYDEMKTSPQKNIITRAMQPGEDNRVKADVVHITDIQAGDYFYLCSDGMLEQMDDDELVSILHGKTSDEAKRNQLIAATADNSDNHSAYLIHVENVEKERGDETQPNDEATTRCNALNIHPQMMVNQSDVQIVSEPLLGKPKSKIKHFLSMPGNKKNLILLIAVLLLAFAFFTYGAYQRIRSGKDNHKMEMIFPKLKTHPIKVPKKNAIKRTSKPESLTKSDSGTVNIQSQTNRDKSRETTNKTKEKIINNKKNQLDGNLNKPNKENITPKMPLEKI
jgi:serine/threonine protein phosphatase PrpC